ncbi:unnamed protein product [Vitrella brassicaformis CCMP3155]|uniref:SCP domain-containing protein n=1 Tax=Vitrella brassicaformis (strain CCMP3155) TaxID=1169540 RepID=A0A0G4GKL9_VITBC|nr:unnamed protein product [Vitrella brassicaformis CCMP3155]|eukprot:CEM30573.1 unnamed protein product [Vitrella brassicaformis CCMP3155]
MFPSMVLTAFLLPLCVYMGLGMELEQNVNATGDSDVITLHPRSSASGKRPSPLRGLLMVRSEHRRARRAAKMISDTLATELQIHINKHRCMHGAPFVQWDGCVANSAQRYANLELLDPIAPYLELPCQGPAAQIFEFGNSTDVPKQIVDKWYSEWSIWANTTRDRYVPEAKRVTVLLWKGAQKVGCGYVQVSSKEMPLWVCHFKGGDQINCETPNVQGCFRENVLARLNKSEPECQLEAQIHAGQGMERESGCTCECKNGTISRQHLDVSTETPFPTNIPTDTPIPEMA